MENLETKNSSDILSEKELKSLKKIDSSDLNEIDLIKNNKISFNGEIFELKNCKVLAKLNENGQERGILKTNGNEIILFTLDKGKIFEIKYGNKEERKDFKIDGNNIVYIGNVKFNRSFDYSDTGFQKQGDNNISITKKEEFDKLLDFYDESNISDGEQYNFEDNEVAFDSMEPYELEEYVFSNLSDKAKEKGIVDVDSYYDWLIGFQDGKYKKINTEFLGDMIVSSIGEDNAKRLFESIKNDRRYDKDFLNILEKKINEKRN